MKISVITASYNYENYIRETIQSVINQSYTDWEMIIIDDCSTDNSVEVIKSFRDDRIKLFVNEKNIGLKETLKLGIKEAAGDWIVFLESDDILKSDYLAKKIEIVQKYSNVAFIFNDVELFGDDATVKYVKPVFDLNNEYLASKTYPCNIFKDLNVHNRILTFSTVMCKKEVLREEYFNTPIDKLLDWWLYVHITYCNNVFYIPEKLTKWRRHSESYINKKQGAKFHIIQIRAYIDVFMQCGSFDLIFLSATVIKVFYAYFCRRLKKIFRFWK